MAVRVYKCVNCSHRMRLFSRNCGLCLRPKRIWQSGGLLIFICCLILLMVFALVTS